MAWAESLASFALGASWADIDRHARQRLRAHVLDTLGCALGALDAPLPGAVRAHVEALGGTPSCTLIGGGRSALDRAAFYHVVLVRQLGLQDALLARAGASHPSEDLAPLLAAAELAGGSGKALLTALAVAYQIDARLGAARPRGLSAAAGVARLVGLDRAQTTEALALVAAGDAPAGDGLLPAGAAARAVQAVLLARRGVTAARPLPRGRDLDWRKEPLDAVERTLIKKYAAEAGAQTAIEAALDLAREHALDARAIRRVRVAVGHVTDPDALARLVAAALLDGELGPAPLAAARRAAPDLARLVPRIRVVGRLGYALGAPARLPASVVVRLADGRRLRRERVDYEGFPTWPMSWHRVVDKFHRLAAPVADAALRREIVSAVANLDAIAAADLAHLLGDAGAAARAPAPPPP